MPVYDLTKVPGVADGIHVGTITDIKELKSSSGDPAIELEVVLTLGPSVGKTYKKGVYFANLIEEFFQAFGEDTRLPNGQLNKFYKSPELSEFQGEDIGFITLTSPSKSDPEKSYSNVKKFFDPAKYDEVLATHEKANADPFDDVATTDEAPAATPAPRGRRR